MPRHPLTLSIVSHGQGQLIRPLLVDLQALVGDKAEVLLTINVAEDETPYQGHGLNLRLIRNSAPKGFGANHNAAFDLVSSAFFVIVNPDIRTPALDLDLLLAPFRDDGVAACAPLVFDSAGELQSSARKFPTWTSLLHRLAGAREGQEYRFEHEPVVVDWLAGMFVVFRADAFRQVGGFDARRFFMYYEDVDIGRRLRRLGWRSVLQPATRVIHDAQRASHRNLRHLRWHTTSALRYLTGL